MNENGAVGTSDDNNTQEDETEMKMNVNAKMDLSHFCEKC